MTGHDHKGGVCVNDLIEIHIVGGPWTTAEAEEIGKVAAALLKRELRREVARELSIRQPTNVENVYCSDVRGEDG